MHVQVSTVLDDGLKISENEAIVASDPSDVIYILGFEI